MKELVTIESVNGKYAEVRVDKKSECAGCGMCAFPKNAQSMKMRAENLAGAKVGDKAIAEREKDGRLLAALLVFGVPLALIGLSAAIGYLWIKKEIFVLVLSLIFLLLWYTILAVIDKKLQKLSGFSWKIVEIYKKGGEDGDKRDNGGDGVL